jgi:hypothetical protein
MQSIKKELRFEDWQAFKKPRTYIDVVLSNILHHTQQQTKERKIDDE